MCLAVETGTKNSNSFLTQKVLVKHVSFKSGSKCLINMLVDVKRYLTWLEKGMAAFGAIFWLMESVWRMRGWRTEFNKQAPREIRWVGNKTKEG